MLLCRVVARQVVVPETGESLAEWGRRLLEACGIDPVVAVTLTGDEELDARAIFDGLGPVPTTSVEAILELQAIGEHTDGRRARGAFYTAHDVCDHVARSCIEPLLARPRPAGYAAACVLDPTCGSGAFLRAAAAVIDELDGSMIGAARVHGLDIDPAAVESCRLLLALDARRRHPQAGHAAIDAAIAANIQVADAIATPEWSLRFPAVMEAGGFAAVIGNPPYVRERSAGRPDLASLMTLACDNTYAWVLERALEAVAPGGRLGMVLPVSLLSGDAFEPCRKLLDRDCSRLWAASFDAVPSTLFPGVVQRLAIVTGERRRIDDQRDGDDPHAARWHVTRYHKWRASERAALLGQVSYVERPPQSVNGAVAKVGTMIEHDILEQLFAHPPAGHLLLRRAHADGTNRFWYKRRWSYFLLFTNFVPPIVDSDGTPRMPTEFKPVDVVEHVDARVLLAAYSSSTFHWFFTAFSDNRNVNRRELEAFPFAAPPPAIANELATLGDELMAALRESAEVRTCTYRSIGTIRNTYFRQAMTRPIIDRIDEVLASHYTFTGEQLRFLKQFEGEYRAAPALATGPSVAAALQR